MIATAPQSETGTLGAVYNASGQLGSAVGTAIMTAVINGVNNGVTDITGLPGYHAAFYANISLLSISALTSAIFIRNETKSKKNSELIGSSPSSSEKKSRELEKGSAIAEERKAEEADITSNQTVIVVSP
jgi:hypothetical protein